jgi:hypothetical protein
MYANMVKAEARDKRMKMKLEAIAIKTEQKSMLLHHLLEV